MDNLLLKKRIIAKKLCRAYFKNSKGKPMELTDGQADIFNMVFLRESRRQNGIGPTQYGKSEALSMGLILRSQIYGEKWWILTGQQAKSDIIMGKCIDHLFDSADLLCALDIDSSTPLERLKRERSRDRLTWKDGGEIRAITADARNRKRVLDSLSGFGNENILEDEAALIPDDLQAMVLRMLGGHNGGYLIKIGNPYNRGHFYKSTKSKKYLQVFIDYKQGLKEERYTHDFIEEMRSEPFFDILYECLFPDEAEIDMDGYRRLLSDSELEKAYDPEWHDAGAKPGEKATDEEKKKYHDRIGKYSENRLGFDPGDGGDENASVKRNKRYAKVVHRSRHTDQMVNVSTAVNLMAEHMVRGENLFWDRNGVGSGSYARLIEKKVNAVGVRWGEKAIKDIFANNKAEDYWSLRDWVKGGGKICDRSLIDELRGIKYKEDSSGKIKIKSKEDMKKQGLKSPNEADALAMTFEKTSDENAPKIIV